MMRYVIEISGEYFIWGKEDPSKSRWTKRCSEATKVSRARADIFVRDWKEYGAKMVKVRVKKKQGE